MRVQWGTVGYSEDTVGIQSVTLLILGSDIFPAKESCLDSLSQDDLSPFAMLLPLCYDLGSDPSHQESEWNPCIKRTTPRSRTWCYLPVV